MVKTKRSIETCECATSLAVLAKNWLLDVNLSPTFYSELGFGYSSGIFKIACETWKIIILPPMCLQMLKALVIAGTIAVSWALLTGFSK